MTQLFGLLIALAVGLGLLAGFLVSPFFFIILLLVPLLAAVPLPGRDRRSGPSTTGGRETRERS